MAKYKNYDTDGEGPKQKDKSPYTSRNRQTDVRNPWPSEDKFKIPEEAVPDWLRQYIKDMYVWGSRVRADILYLEQHAKHPTGDPGDPPAGPW